MALPFYLAATAAEMAGNHPLSLFPAYMACHFSPCGEGLSNLPEELSPGAMLILDDSTPMDGHDPDLVLTQLSAQIERHRCESLLLDFQRMGIEEQEKLAKQLSEQLPCLVGVSELYAHGLVCPVFLPPVPPDRSLTAHLAPWTGREIWLEAALNGVTLTVTKTGCNAAPVLDFPEKGLQDSKLHCHYTVDSPAIFCLWRTREDLDALLKEAEDLDVTKAIGLWQELGW